MNIYSRLILQLSRIFRHQVHSEDDRGGAPGVPTPIYSRHKRLWIERVGQSQRSQPGYMPRITQQSPQEREGIEDESQR